MGEQNARRILASSDFLNGVYSLLFIGPPSDDWRQRVTRVRGTLSDRGALSRDARRLSNDFWKSWDRLTDGSTSS